MKREEFLELVEDPRLKVVKDFISKYVTLRAKDLDVAARYVLFTYRYSESERAPILHVIGGAGTGKTRFLEVVGLLCYRPIVATGATSVSSLLRVLNEERGTLVLEEADYQQTDDSVTISAVLNVGFRRYASLRATRSRSYFRVFGPKIIATRSIFAGPHFGTKAFTIEMRGPGDDVPVILRDEFYEELDTVRNLITEGLVDQFTC